MARGLFVSSTGPRSGKSIVELGLMELLTGHGRKVGYFRPVIQGGPAGDDAIRLMAGRFDMGVGPEAMFGCTNDTALEFVSEGRQEELLSRILTKYKAVESQHDVVLCSGTDYRGVSAAPSLPSGMRSACAVASARFCRPATSPPLSRT